MNMVAVLPRLSFTYKIPPFKSFLMQHNHRAFIESLNLTYFEGALSPAQQFQFEALDTGNAEAVHFIEQALGRLKSIGVQARDCTEFIFWEMASIWPKILPGAWSGIVPPITFQNRHI